MRNSKTNSVSTISQITSQKKRKLIGTCRSTLVGPKTKRNGIFVFCNLKKVMSYEGS